MSIRSSASISRLVRVPVDLSTFSVNSMKFVSIQSIRTFEISAFHTERNEQNRRAAALEREQHVDHYLWPLSVVFHELGPIKRFDEESPRLFERSSSSSLRSIVLPSFRWSDRARARRLERQSKVRSFNRLWHRTILMIKDFVSSPSIPVFCRSVISVSTIRSSPSWQIPSRSKRKATANSGNESNKVLTSGHRSEIFSKETKLERQQFPSSNRILVFSKKRIVAVKVSIDSKFLGVARQSNDSSNLFLLEWNPSIYRDEKSHRILVEISVRQNKRQRWTEIEIDSFFSFWRTNKDEKPRSSKTSASQRRSTFDGRQFSRIRWFCSSIGRAWFERVRWNDVSIDRANFLSGFRRHFVEFADLHYLIDFLSMSSETNEQWRRKLEFSSNDWFVSLSRSNRDLFLVVEQNSSTDVRALLDWLDVLLSLSSVDLSLSRFECSLSRRKLSNRCFWLFHQGPWYVGYLTEARFGFVFLWGTLIGDQWIPYDMQLYVGTIQVWSDEVRLVETKKIFVLCFQLLFFLVPLTLCLSSSSFYRFSELQSSYDVRESRFDFLVRLISVQIFFVYSLLFLAQWSFGATASYKFAWILSPFGVPLMVFSSFLYWKTKRLKIEDFRFHDCSSTKKRVLFSSADEQSPNKDSWSIVEKRINEWNPTFYFKFLFFSAKSTKESFIDARFCWTIRHFCLTWTLSSCRWSIGSMNICLPVSLLERMMVSRWSTIGR